jgi:enamine deaminase RidA (YjgF/YER057c/UK114 family)
MNRLQRPAGPKHPAMVSPVAINGACGRASSVNLEDCSRLALVLTSSGKGDFQSQASEILRAIQSALESQPYPMWLSSQTVFLQDASNEAEFRKLIRSEFGSVVTTFVSQAPCCGAAIAVEAWGIGGPGARIDRLSGQAVALAYDGARWVYCGDICVPEHPEGVYAQSGIAMQRMRRLLAEAGTDLSNSVRTWFYLGGITDLEGGAHRYTELNRARTDFYERVRFQSSLLVSDPPRGHYPASTGIGVSGRSLSAGCLTVQTDRKDARLLALENPQQTPAYAYHPKYSPQSPKFSRAMALIMGDSVTTWISGTASIVNSESRHTDDPARQTEQTIDNIERLMSSDNFIFHGIQNGGVTLSDIAKLRVYVKRAGDFEIVRGVCQRRFGATPVLYAVAEVCRPELLVEIEGVAFSRLRA